VIKGRFGWRFEKKQGNICAILSVFMKNTRVKWHWFRPSERNQRYLQKWYSGYEDDGRRGRRYFKKIGMLSKSASGWTKELNLMRWNEQDPSYDLREWSPDRQRRGKGVTLSKEELAALKELLNKYGGVTNCRAFALLPHKSGTMSQ
jgi:hypothetical protein